MAGQAAGNWDWPPTNGATISPQNPTSADTVFITLSGDWRNSCTPNGSGISVVGNDIYFDVIWDYPPGTICLLYIAYWERTESVGPLSPGTYTVYARLLGDPETPETYTYMTQFTVTQFTPTEFTYHVDGIDGNDLNDGLSLETAFATIQKGINTAADGDTVLVYPAVYTEDLDFLGKAITVKSAAEPAVLEAADYYAVSFYHGEDAESVLKNFIIRNSNAGLFFYAASPTIDSVTVVDNNVGAWAESGADPNISNSIFWNNSYGDLYECEAQYSYVGGEIEDGRIAHWKFDEGDGNTAYDSAGSYDGTIYGAGWTTGWIGGALDFDGDDGVYVEGSAGTGSSLNMYSSDLTISSWVKIRGTGGTIVARAKPSYITYRLGVSTNKAYINTYKQGPGHWLLYTDEILEPETWYHIVGVFDRAGDIGRVYVDGVQEAEGAMTTDPLSNDATTKIGCRTDTGDHAFDGTIDEVMIFDRVVSPEEILQPSWSAPLFVDASSGDYHLLSEGGRYVSEHNVWVVDDVTSPCVDSGDPTVNPGNEPMPNGGRINIGAYGNTPYASMSQWPIPDDINPANRAEDICPGVSLIWTPDESVVDHNVYFGTSLSDVNESAAPVQSHWGPNSWKPNGLELSTTYYWRIDGINDGGVDRPGAGFAWIFTTGDGKASDPYPSDGQTRIPLDAKLAWSAGCVASSHDVYFSSDFNDVNERNPAAFQGNQSEDTFDPGGLDYYTRYYWRVDEVNDTNNWQGEVWSFRTQDEIIDPNLLLWYRLDETDGNVANDSSGYEHHGVVDGPNEGPDWDPDHGGCLAFGGDTTIIVPNDVLSDIDDGITIMVWLSGAYQPDSNNWLFDTGAGDYRVQAAFLTYPEPQLLWRAGNNTNDVLTWDLAGIDPCTLEEWYLWAFVKDENTGTMSIYSGAPVRGPTYECAIACKTGADETLVNLRNTPFKIGASIDQNNVFVGKMDDFGIYDFALPESSFSWLCPLPPECAWTPYPYDDQTDAPPNVVLAWMPGDLAASHDVYLGTSWNEVNDANRSCHPNVDYNNVTEATYDPGPLELGRTYYWRVDEVNEPNLWKCRIWNFTTADYLVIDDMEIYTPGFDSEYPITQQTGSYGWDCGYTNVSGSQLELQTAEPVRDYQSMLYYYDNSVNWGNGCYCVISNHFVLDPCDWTSFGVKALSLWFYGDPNNDADETEQMYVALEDTNGAYAEVRYPLEDMNDIRLSEWQRWDIALSSFSDVNLFSVKHLYIGFGQMSSLIPGGDGIVHFDDIRLYPPICVPQYAPQADFSGNCTVNLEDYAILANQWFRPPGDPSADVAPQPPDGIVNWRDLAVLADEWLQRQLWP